MSDASLLAQVTPEGVQRATILPRGRSEGEVVYTPLDLITPIAQAAVDRSLWDFSPDDVAGWVNTHPASVAHKQKISSGKLYGVWNVGAHKVSLTALGYWICQTETTMRARLIAFMNVEVFRQLALDYSGKPLPPLTEIESDLANLGIAWKQRQRARQIFMKSARYVGILRANVLALPDDWETYEVPPLPDRTPANVHATGGTERVLAQMNEAIMQFRENKALLGALSDLPKPGYISEEDFQGWLDMFESALRYYLRLPRPRKEVP